MGFSGMRAVILVVVFVGLFFAVSKFHLPNWTPVVGLMIAAVLLRGAENKASKDK